MWIRTDHVSAATPSRNSTINHEFGHVLGLLDPPLGGPCGSFPSSIMHQYSDYGCPAGSYIEWPYTADKNSVVNNVMTLP
jgi:hypothetical protein